MSNDTDVPPLHVQHAAKTLADWMAQHGHSEWILHGCADAATVIRLDRQCQDYLLRIQAEHERRKQIAQAVTQLFSLLTPQP